MAAEVSPASVPANDDVLTVCAVSLLAASLANILKGWAMLQQLCSPTQNRVCCLPSRGPATSTRDLLPRGERWRTWRLPWFFGLHCAARRADRFGYAFFCSQVLRLTSLLAPGISSFPVSPISATGPP